MTNLSQSDRPHSPSLQRWFIGAKLAGQGPKLPGPVERDDHAYRFRSNEQAAEVAVASVVEWLRREGGSYGAHGSIPALHAAAAHIERQEKAARKQARDG